MVIIAIDNTYSPRVPDQHDKVGRDVYVVNPDRAAWRSIAVHPFRPPGFAMHNAARPIWEWGAGLCFASIPLAAAILAECLSDLGLAHALAPQFAREVLAYQPRERWQLSCHGVRAWVMEKRVEATQ